MTKKKEAVAIYSYHAPSTLDWGGIACDDGAYDADQLYHPC